MSTRLFSRTQLAGLIAIMGASILCLRLISTSKPKLVHFETLREFKDFALSKGFRYPEQSVFSDSFFIAGHQPSAKLLNKLHAMDKRLCGLTPEWRGLLWVSALHS